MQARVFGGILPGLWLRHFSAARPANGVFYLVQMEQGSYYAVIPANVRYCKEVPDGAKLLYGEITALCNSHGYCWASNKYFSDLYGKSSDTISRWISQLAQAGFILTLVDNQKGNARKIWLAESQTYRQKSVDPIGKNADTLTAKIRRPYRQKSVDPIGKNAVPYKENNTVNNTLNNTEEENAQNALSAPFLHVGTIELPNSNIPLEVEKKENDFTGGAAEFRVCGGCHGAGWRLGRNGREYCPQCNGSRMEFIVTTHTPQEPYTRIVEMVETQASPGAKIRAMIEAGNYRIKEVFSMRNKIPAARFDEYLNAYDLEQTALPEPRKYKDANDLVSHFWNWSGIHWAKEQRASGPGIRPTNRGGAQLRSAGSDLSKYEEKQVF